MYSVFKTPDKIFRLETDKFVCNKFGLAEFLAEHFDKLGIETVGHALDAGCGAGPISLFLAQRFGCRVTGVELNPTAHKLYDRNISEYDFHEKANSLCADMCVFAAGCEENIFDLIAANPPADENVSADIIGKYANDDYSEMNAESFAYLTNSWRCADGLDLTDQIFLCAQRSLKRGGRVVIVFCSIDCGREYVLNKAAKYGFVVEHIIDGRLSAESIGAPENILEINAVLVSFVRGDNFGDQGLQRV